MTEQEGLQILPEDRDGADVILDCSSFHRLAPKTGNASLPTVVRQKMVLSDGGVTTNT